MPTLMLVSYFEKQVFSFWACEPELSLSTNCIEVLRTLVDSSLVIRLEFLEGSKQHGWWRIQ